MYLYYVLMYCVCRFEYLSYLCIYVLVYLCVYAFMCLCIQKYKVYTIYVYNTTSCSKKSIDGILSYICIMCMYIYIYIYRLVYLLHWCHWVECREGFREGFSRGQYCTWAKMITDTGYTHVGILPQMYIYI